MFSKYLMFLLAAGALSPCATFGSPSNEVLTSKLFEDYGHNDTACRGGSGGSNETWMACGARDYIGELLRQRGWCHGKHGEYSAQMQWHECTPVSIGWSDD
jgi:hypothetical protein